MTRIKNILIVGGGTSGWLSATYLARMLGANGPDGVKVTLIESEDIGTVGVGEATVPPIRTMIASLGLSEAEFMRETSATFKLSIRFDDWLGRETNGKPDKYYHTFGSAGQFGQEVQEYLAPYWVLSRDKSGLDFVDFSMMEGRICDAGRGPKRADHPPYAGPIPYAYHFDAGLLAQLLKRVGISNGVTHLIGTVTDVRLAEDGSIEALATEEHGTLTADLYIDCTGFGAHLIEKALAVPFHDFSETLFCDEAIACQVSYDDPRQPIPPFTIATAQTNGWTWDIPLNNRRGIGYVYSTAHTTAEQAEQVLDDYIGAGARQTKRWRLKMRTGSRRQQWFKNCVAVGLSAGFIEPLESTGIHILDLALRRLVEYWPPLERMELAAKQFNEVMNFCYADIVDFVKMHYALSGRTDTEFWIDNRRDESLTASLRDKLEAWKYRVPSIHEFANYSNVFGLAGHLQVLYGMDYLPDLTGQSNRYRRWQEAETKSVELQRRARAGLDVLPDHRALIEAIYSQKV